MTREEAIWWVNHLFEIRKEEYFNKGMMEDAKEVEEAQTMVLEALQREDRFLKSMETNDPLYTEVVRCKDCRYFKKIAERSDSGLCHRDIVASAWKENGYCSRGERKGGGDE